MGRLDGEYHQDHPQRLEFDRRHKELILQRHPDNTLPESHTESKQQRMSLMKVSVISMIRTMRQEIMGAPAMPDHILQGQICQTSTC